MDQATKRELLACLERDARHLCERFGLRYRVLEAERANVKRRYGVCFSDGTIRIRLRHSATGRPLKYSSLVNTLCHELAHLRHFNHGPHFQAFYQQILEFARRSGIYRPKLGAATTQHAALDPAVGRIRPAPLRLAASDPFRGPTGAQLPVRGGLDGRGVPEIPPAARVDKKSSPISGQLELFSSSGTHAVVPARSR